MRRLCHAPSNDGSFLKIASQPYPYTAGTLIGKNKYVPRNQDGSPEVIATPGHVVSIFPKNGSSFKVKVAPKGEIALDTAHVDVAHVVTTGSAEKIVENALSVVNEGVSTSTKRPHNMSQQFEGTDHETVVEISARLVLP